ncbi:MAG: DUF4391 domain-containing protein [Flavobacterium sp.]|nr:DUF4391 domain-containing protein [Pedobacter sp.]
MDFLNNILQLPHRCLLNKKITKAFFKRNFDLSIAERSLLDTQIENIDWIASLNPENINVNTYVNEDLIYEEIQVIAVIIRDKDFENIAIKVAELIHKYIPYAILLCVYDTQQMVWSTYHKRIHQNDFSKRMIDKRYFSEAISLSVKSSLQSKFLESLAYQHLEKANLFELYNGYTQRIFALQASKLNSTFTVRTQSRTQSDMLLLEELNKLQEEIDGLSNTAKKETQLNKQVDLNLQIQHKRTAMAQLKLKIAE